MNAVDYVVLFGAVIAIAVYGIVRTRGRRNLHDYLRGKQSSWFFIGLSVMATQASAVTFLSTPGQGYAGGMAFVQNYFAIPVALVIIAAVFLPIYRRFNVYTAYEYLGQRFDKKTRLLAASLFLMQRALGAGITIYAPAIVLSTVFGWSLQLTIIASGLVVMAYTVAGGSDAVTHTQKYQIGVIVVGMITAFFILLSKIPCSFGDALTLAGHFGKTNAVSFKPDLKERYTFWTGMLGGIFLMLSYFGTDQSQVQRYISGDDLRESRLGLMFHGLFKIPMQFGILLLGVMLFVFYQFNPAPIMFNQTAWNKTPMGVSSMDSGRNPGWGRMIGEVAFQASEVAKRESLTKWVDARHRGDAEGENNALKAAVDASVQAKDARDAAIEATKERYPTFNSTNDADYVFISFILDNLPHGLIGLLVACFFLATLSAKAAELNALASTTTVDFYRYIIRPPVVGGDGAKDATQDRHYVIASKAFTAMWGFLAIGFALFLHMAENLIQASNIVGSLFSGCVLGLFLLAFFFKWVRGSAAFTGAGLSQLIVFVVHGLNYFGVVNIAYLWYNLIGAVGCVLFAVMLQPMFGSPDEGRGFPPVMEVIENRVG